MPQPRGDLAPRSWQSLTPQRHFLLQQRATPKARESLTPQHWGSLALQIHFQLPRSPLNLERLQDPLRALQPRGPR